MDTNTIGRLYQAGRNTVRRQDFLTKGDAQDLAVGAEPEETHATLLPKAPVPAMRARSKRRIENFLTEALAAVVWSD